jgi:hypothetical protein
MHEKYWFENTKERDYLEDLDKMENSVRMCLEKQDMRVWTGFI